VWGLVIENLTTLVAVILSLLITVRFAISKNAFITIIVISVFTAVSVQVIDTDYFLSRLEISNESNNLSVLVLLQGWETSVEMIKMTGAWGVGFQQFGFIDVSGEIIEKIANLGEEGLNKLDGGSMAAKITGEFGVLGLAAIFMIVIQAFRAYLRLKSAKLNDCSGGQILLSASLFTYVIELFARGVGYFSPTGFLVLCALINVYCYEKRSRS
jgi:O-antigen ligase